MVDSSDLSQAASDLGGVDVNQAKQALDQAAGAIDIDKATAAIKDLGIEPAQLKSIVTDLGSDLSPETLQAKITALGGDVDPDKLKAAIDSVDFDQLKGSLDTLSGSVDDGGGGLIDKIKGIFS